MTGLTHCPLREIRLFPKPQSVFHSVYNQKRCSRGGQLFEQRCEEQHITNTDDKLFLVDSFFSWVTQTKGMNIYVDAWEYWNALDLL